MNSLSKISDRDLENQLRTLVHKERRLLHVILQHINEVDVRKIYLERAYSSLYEYLTKELGYSGSAAMRRIQAARLLKEAPTVAEKIESGAINLSQITELSRMVKEKESTTGTKVSVLQKLELVEMMSGKTHHETQRNLALALDVQPKAFEIQRTQKDETVRLELTLTKEQFAKLKDCRDRAGHLLSADMTNNQWADVLEILADQFLKKKNSSSDKSPKIKFLADSSIRSINLISSQEQNPRLNENHNKNQSQLDNNYSLMKNSSVADQVKSCDGNILKSVNENSGKLVNAGSTKKRQIKLTTEAVLQRKNRSLTPKVRTEILKRDSCCQYVDPLTLKKCGSTYQLEIDHKTSQWAGGGHDPTNLQVLCARHNKFKYFKETRIRKV